MQLPCSHKCMREMEHELFQSKLKPSVDGALLSNVIRSSSSGKNSYRTTAMELLFERSIQARRKRAFTKVEEMRPDPTLQPMMSCETPNTSTAQIQSPTPPTALQSTSQSLSNVNTSIVTSPTPAATKHEVSQESPNLPKTPQKVEVTRHEGPPADAKIDASSSEGIMQLVCQRCKVERLRSHPQRGVFCDRCPPLGWLSQLVKCAGCGTPRVSGVEACTYCHQKFKSPLL